jgi:hypothetical protein
VFRAPVLRCVDQRYSREYYIRHGEPRGRLAASGTANEHVVRWPIHEHEEVVNKEVSSENAS